ncbi:hypothetical protein BRN42_02930 [Xanthomonas oryzae pv. oryzae]|nr:hypothetical protein BRN42_02930 [Xanthomonas oryzae pv. oryzae]
MTSGLSVVAVGAVGDCAAWTCNAGSASTRANASMRVLGAAPTWRREGAANWRLSGVMGTALL